MVLRLLLPLLLALPIVARAEGPPPALMAIERALDDHPRQVLDAAEAALQGATPGSAEAWRAQVWRLAAAAALEQEQRLVVLLPPVLAAARERPPGAGEQCLLDSLSILAGRVQDGAPAAERAAAIGIERAQRANQPWCVARLQLARGQMHANDGRIAQAMSDTQAALTYFESAGETTMRAQALSNLGWLYRRDRDNPESVARAIESARAAVDLLDASRQRYLASTMHHNLAGVYLAAGQRAPAREHAAQSLRHAEALGDTLGMAYVERLLARLDLDEGQRAAALARFVRAQRVFADAGLSDLELVAATGRAEALLALGRVADARRQLAETDALRARVAHADLDAEYWRVSLEAQAAAGDAAATANAARAYAQALRARERDQNQRIAAELRERFRSERAEAENRLLREQQQSAQARQWGLVATLALAAVLLALGVLHIAQQRRLRQRLKRLAEVDELTGLPNRRSILETARRVAAGQRAADHPACIALIDIDHFKRVNDGHGHEVGDAALVAFAQACRGALRQHDAVGRMGGEEFLMVLPATRPDEAERLFERLRAALRATVVPGLPAGQRLACSMGCAELPPGAPVQQALRRADAALYRAKAEGRDRLALAA